MSVAVCFRRASPFLTGRTTRFFPKTSTVNTIAEVISAVSGGTGPPVRKPRAPGKSPVDTSRACPVAELGPSRRGRGAVRGPHARPGRRGWSRSRTSYMFEKQQIDETLGAAASSPPSLPPSLPPYLPTFLPTYLSAYLPIVSPSPTTTRSSATTDIDLSRPRPRLRPLSLSFSLEGEAQTAQGTKTTTDTRTSHRRQRGHRIDENQGLQATHRREPQPLLVAHPVHTDGRR